jgi:hypothetical protein
LETGMFLQDFDTTTDRFSKIQKYLRENHKCEIATDKLTYTTANKLIETTTKKMDSIRHKDQKEYAKLQMIREGLELWKVSPVQFVKNLDEAMDDDSVDEAKVIISAQDLSIELQKIIEKLAELQVQNLIPIIDKMKSEIGLESAERFNDKVDSAFGELLNVAKSTKDSLNDAILVASGKAQPSMNDMDSMKPDMGTDSELDLDMDDQFGGDDSVSGDFGPEGRKLKAESIGYHDALVELKNSTSAGKINRSTLESIISRVKK